MMPATVWTVFSARWIEITKAPSDAPLWLKEGYLTLTAQGKLTGYAIAPRGYALIVDRLWRS
ncbi:MAG TPA: hypothetical protein PLC99_22355 [Verrucomicrobiota bacterium]|nr:hypothetical protein [Verrucomicrobiota bacterium]